MISKEEVKHIAKLARLELSGEEMERMQKDLSQVLDYFRILDELDTSGTEPTSHSIPLKNVMRDDEVKKCRGEEIKQIFTQVPEKEGKYVKVREVLT